MPTSPTNTYGCEGLQPFYDPQQARTQPVKLPASVTYSKGQVLGETIGNNEVQTIVIDATGGTFTITFGGNTTSALDFDATAAQVQAALEALASIGAGNVEVSKHWTRWTLTHSNGTDAGTFGLKITVNGVSQIAAGLAWDATAATIDTALEALDVVGTGGVAVTGNAGGPYTLTFLPTLGDVEVEVVNDDTNDGGVWEGGITVAQLAEGAYVVEFVNALGNQNVAAMTTGAGSLTGGAGTATVATATAGSAGTAGTFRAYDPTGSDGRQVAKCILQYDVDVDASGNITVGGGEYGETYKTAPAYFAGTFLTSELIDLDEAAVSQLGRLISGTVASGVLRMG